MKSGTLLCSEIFHRFRPKFPQSLARNFFLWKEFSSCEKVIFFSFLFFRCIYSLQTDKNGNIVLKNATWGVVNGAVNFCFFFHRKRNFAETILLFEISAFFGSMISSGEKHYFFDHIRTRWSKIFFMKVKNKKHFLLESINLSQPWTQYVDRVSHDRDFSHFFHFHLPWKWAKYAKIVPKNLKKVDPQKQGKRVQNPFLKDANSRFL